MTDTYRMEKLLALILLANMKGASQQDRIKQLSLAGFSNLEIADIVQTTAAVVSQSLYVTRSATSRKAPTKRAVRTKKKRPK